MSLSRFICLSFLIFISRLYFSRCNSDNISILHFFTRYHCIFSYETSCKLLDFVLIKKQKQFVLSIFNTIISVLKKRILNKIFSLLVSNIREKLTGKNCHFAYCDFPLKDINTLSLSTKINFSISSLSSLKTIHSEFCTKETKSFLLAIDFKRLNSFII